MLNLDCALAVGHSVRYAGEPNGESYMELVVRCRATGTAHTHILKANHPDDARNWVRDLQARQSRPLCHSFAWTAMPTHGCVTSRPGLLRRVFCVLHALRGMLLP